MKDYVANMPILRKKSTTNSTDLCLIKMTLTRLKREKLKIKDEIARLGTTSSSATPPASGYH